MKQWRLPIIIFSGMVLIGSAIWIVQEPLQLAIAKSKIVIASNRLPPPAAAIFSHPKATPNQTMVLPPAPTERVLLAQLNTERVSRQLDPLIPNDTLDRVAKLGIFSAEDSQDLNIRDDIDTLLNSLGTKRPTKFDAMLVFVPIFQNLDRVWTASLSASLQPDTKEIGIATRSGILEGIPGTYVSVLVSSIVNNPIKVQSAKTKVEDTPALASFTGADLWQAVQNYRQSHNLPLFQQANELCTVASIRLNELLTLGHLDNHDGFKPRSEQFFKDNPGWTSINENIAEGYDTAVQTVEWGWDKSLGHQAVMQSRDFPKACTAANRSFSVLITGR
jgi:uncharacterized protein YkwD